MLKDTTVWINNEGYNFIYSNFERDVAVENLDGEVIVYFTARKTQAENEIFFEGYLTAKTEIYPKAYEDGYDKGYDDATEKYSDFSTSSRCGSRPC